MPDTKVPPLEVRVMPNRPRKSDRHLAMFLVGLELACVAAEQFLAAAANHNPNPATDLTADVSAHLYFLDMMKSGIGSVIMGNHHEWEQQIEASADAYAAIVATLRRVAS